MASISTVSRYFKDHLTWISPIVIFQLCSIVLALWMEMIVLMWIPAILGVLIYFSIHVRFLFFLLAVILPYSVEFELPYNLATDLPSEPIMWMVTALFPLYFLPELLKYNRQIVTHPILLLLVASFIWLILVSLLSSVPMHSAKYTLAKIWYIIPFYFFFGFLFDQPERIRTFFKILLLSLGTVIFIILIRQGLTGFLFSEVNETVYPMFRNHVSYAIMIAALLPFVWAMMYRSQHKWFWFIWVLIMLVAIYFSYTRAAMVAVIIGVLSYWIFRFRLFQWIYTGSFIALIAVLIWLNHNNRYLDFAPDFDRTITHDKFENLVQATYKLEDISTMERVYRWLAGIEMIKEKPVFGFGPSTFYSHYQEYGSNVFRTYVSHNPEKSGIHNYYLMMGVEQGIPGLLIFLVLIITALSIGQRNSFNIKDAERRVWIWSAMVSLVIICSTLLMNDLIETDKIGSLFFINLSIITVLSCKRTPKM